MVAERYGISAQTVWRWRKRDSVHDRSHTAHRLQTTLTAAQGSVALRKSLLLPLDDLLSVVREFLDPGVSRSGLDRCLRRHVVGNLRDLKPPTPRPAHKPFEVYAHVYLHIDVQYLPQMADEDRQSYSSSPSTAPQDGPDSHGSSHWNATDGVDGSRSRHRNVPHWVLSQSPLEGAIHEGDYHDRMRDGGPGRGGEVQW